MNGKSMAAVAALLVLGVSAGYWLGAHHTPSATGAAKQADKSERKILYYRNPMGLPDTSPVPKKDSMGMDYVPVYEGEETQDDGIAIASGKVQKLGVKSEAVAKREIAKTVRASGRIEIDEARSFAIAPKFEGWIERLHANTTGQVVAKGQPLFEVYSPELISAWREHELALQGVDTLKDADAKADMRRLAEASAARLRNWDVEGASMSGVSKSHGGRTLLYRAAVSGAVLEKSAVEGMRFMPGEVLYRVADLSTVWVMADVAEQDIGGIAKGNPVKISIDAYPGKRFDGRVDFIYPAMNSSTRTVPVRIAIPNREGLLKPAMFASVEFTAGSSAPVVSVPLSAVIDSGKRQVVLIRLNEGRFQPREVTLGRRGDGYVEVLEGVAEGEQVVSSANFLIDAESNLRAALSGMGGAGQANADGQVGDADPSASAKPAGSVGHKGRGVLKKNYGDGSVSIAHEPIASLGWSAMTMDFDLAYASLADGIAPGTHIDFEIVERAPGEWVITKLKALPQADAPGAQPAHGGH